MQQERVAKAKMKKAFTLIEILIAICIVVALFAFSIPAILRSRTVANEGVIISSLRIIADACQLYHANLNSYPESLSELAMPNSNPPYIDTSLASGTKYGYTFIYNRENSGFFSVNANPQSSTFGRYYYIDQSGIIRVNANQQAGPNDETVS